MSANTSVKGNTQSERERDERKAHEIVEKLSKSEEVKKTKTFTHLRFSFDRVHAI